jgi:hypothetical protein
MSLASPRPSATLPSVRASPASADAPPLPPPVEPPLPPPVESVPESMTFGFPDDEAQPAAVEARASMTSVRTQIGVVFMTSSR